MNCRSVRREIEAADLNTTPSSGASEHLKSCGACATFCEEHIKLRNIVSNLGAVEAPGDFEFRLRARLAAEETSVRHFPFRNLTFGFRSVAFATLLLLFGFALLVVSLRSSHETPATTDRAAATGVDTRGLYQANVQVNPEVAPPSEEVKPGSLAPEATSAVKPDATGKQTFVASSGNRRVRSRDMGSAAAPVLRSADLLARASDFPIETSPQPLKVSLDNGRGSRTISLPTVSFGSQRVVSQGDSPLIASARGAW